MDESTSRLKALQDRFGPAVWLFASVLVPVVGGILFVWRVFVYPAIDDYAQHLKASIQVQIEQQITQLKEINDKNDKFVNSALDQIKHKISDEFDSTYYLTKTFTINETSIEQDPLNQFFYVAEKDVVLLFIWSSGLSTKMEISINDGTPKTLKDFGKNSWSNVDITDVVKKSSALDVEQYPGIGENVYNIKITPIPKGKNMPQKQGIANISERPPQKGAKDTPQKEEGGNEVDIYALVLVRRSPFQ